MSKIERLWQEAFEVFVMIITMINDMDVVKASVLLLFLTFAYKFLRKV